MSYIINPFSFATDTCTYISNSALTAYWKMDGDSTDSINSLNGSDINITYTGTPAVFLSSMNVTGNTNAYSIVGGSLLLQTATTFTIMCWFYPRVTNDYQSIIDLTGWNTKGPYRMWVDNASSRFLFTIGGNNVWTAANSLTANTWHHIALTRTNNSTAKYYINGVQSNFGANTLVTSETLAKFVFGNRYRDDTGTYPGDFLDGLIDDAAYFKRVLTADEVKSVYTGGTVNGCRLSSL